MVSEFLAGTYAEHEAAGIYRFGYDFNKNEITMLKNVSPLRRASYLCKDGDYVYAVSEVPLDEGNNGSVYAYRKTADGLFFVNKIDHLPSLIPFVTTDGMGQHLFMTGYGTGEIISAALLKGGKLADTVYTCVHRGKSVHPVRQQSAHPHSAWLTPDKKLLCVCDLGTDDLIVYEIGKEGTLSESKTKGLKLSPGEGPRHLAFHPTGTHAYVLTEMGYRIAILHYEYETGFTVEGYADAGPGLPESQRSGGAVRISHDGKFLYCSNRGSLSSRIDCFSIKNDFSLRHIGYCAERISMPRDFIITQNDAFLLVANQLADEITVYQRNAETGMPTLAGVIGRIPKPACIVEI